MANGESKHWAGDLLCTNIGDLLCMKGATKEIMACVNYPDWDARCIRLSSFYAAGSSSSNPRDSFSSSVFFDNQLMIAIYLWHGYKK